MEKMELSEALKANASVLEGLLGVSSSTIFKGKGYIQLETEDDIDKVYEPGVYAIKGTSYNDQTLLVFSHNLGQSTVQFRTNNYGGFLVFRIKWWNGAWGTWKTVSLFALLEGLFTSLKLFPFMFRGDVNVTSYDETGALDTVIEMGIYKVKPKQGVWGTLVVFNAFDGAGGVVQKLYNATGAKYRVKNSNTDNLWTDWKSF